MRTLVAAAIVVACQWTTAHAGDRVGFAELDVFAPHHGRAITGAVWYPAGGGGTSTILGDSPVFVGERVELGGQVAEGQHPVVLMSHASGGQFRSLAWLAAGLSRRGAIVIAVNHPGSTLGDFDVKQSMDLGSRVLDLEAAIETASTAPLLQGHLDLSRIYATGYLLGGWTALSIGGLRGQPQSYAQHCRLVGDRSKLCVEIADAGIDLDTLDPSPWQKGLKDGRIRAVAVIEPELLYSLTAEDARNLVNDVTLIGLGADDDRLRATDFGEGGSGFVRLVPKAEVNLIAPASHFTAMPECKPAGAEILAEDGDDPVCSDPPGTNRGLVHAEILSTVAAAFDLH